MKPGLYLREGKLKNFNENFICKKLLCEPKKYFGYLFHLFIFFCVQKKCLKAKCGIFQLVE